MNTKKIFLIVLGLIVIMCVVAFANGKNTEPDYTSDTSNTSGVPATSTSTPADSSASGYTLAEVATHNTPADCWTAISGNVYNVTSWISKHPGGSDAIIYLCGKDGTAAFTGQHGGQPRPADELMAFKIGSLR
jgi:cytochrome b involved in lipid metabolism